MTDKSLLFYLDNTLLATDPRGWDDINFFVKRDKDLNGLLVFIDAELEFFGDGYELIKTKFYSEGFCATMDLRIMESCADGNYRNIHEGIIMLSKITIDEKLCSITVKPDDNSFYAKIDKNRSLNVLPWVDQSKNGVTITPVDYTQIGFFTPSTGVYHSIGSDASCAGYKPFELFQYLIAWMTDGTVDFDSTLFGSGGELEYLMITTGTVLFTVQSGLSTAVFQDTFPEDLSFDNYFKEIYKKEAIGFYVDYSGLRPKLWIEKINDIPSGTTAATIDSIKYGIKTTVDTQRLYSKLRIGSTTTVDAVSLAFPEGIDWVGFKEEEYNILGNCGIDTTLDLVSDYIISSNVIEDAVETPSDNYEGQFALIECRELVGSDFVLAVQTNNLTGANPPYFYNQGLINSEVAPRFLGAVPVSIAKFLGNGTSGKFRASMTNSINFGNTFGFFLFDDDFTSPNFDSGNNYDPIGSTYIAPATGLYTFEVTLLNFSVNNNFFLQIRDSGFAFIRQINMGFPVGGATVAEATRSVSVYLHAGEAVITRSPGSADIGSSFACVSSTTGGGVYHTYDPKDYLGLNHEFECDIKNSQWIDIRTNPRGNIVFGQADQDLRTAIIDTFRFNKTGISQMKVLRTINTA